MNIFSRLKEGLQKTRAQIAAIVGMARFDASFYEHVEEALIAADIGLDLSVEVAAQLKDIIERKGIKTAPDAYNALKEILAALLMFEPKSGVGTTIPHIILVAGVNGVGKTTTIGKLTNEYTKAGKKVMLGAVDTFRAGAIEQLRIWSQRTGAEFVAQQEMSDPASVAYDAVQSAIARKMDILIIDTAGRLHNKVNLMNELEKIIRVIKRQLPEAPHETLLVIDATTGQNAIKQAASFNEILGVTGLIITKLDGTAKGGIAFALMRQFGIPIKKIGVGEGIDDLQDFDAKAYVEAMFGDLEIPQ